MVPFAQLIQQHHAAILALWTERVRASASAKGLTTPGLQNVMTSYLSALADEDTGGVAARRRLLESHLSSRVRLGYALPEIVEEILELGTCIAEVGAQLPAGERPDAAVLAPVLAALRDAATTATDIFWEYLREDQQLEKSLLRRIQAIASASRDDPTPAGGFIARLEEVLSIIAEGIPARCLAIALANGELSTAASVGEGADACRRASTSGLGRVLDEAASGHAGSAIERTVHRDQVVVVRLPEHGDALGVLYAVRVEPFTAREVRRLEAVGALVAVLLENAHLYAALRRRIAEADGEKRLRETFVSVLAHDLRGPLTIAKMSADTLAKAPDLTERQRRLVQRVLSGMDRTDRMVTDLLDANRIRAGHRLAMTFAPCDLAAIVREVVSDLATGQGGRFLVGGMPSAVGTWSADHLRRIVANLATNAAKYGAPGAAIEIDVQATDSAASLSVHNAGDPIPADALPRLFDSFSRARDPQGVTGWGLGLTLVKGSVEAHGGSVCVESSREAGTTFTVVLPRDSRAFQHET